MTQKRNAPILFAGYECQEADGDFMLVFASPVQAVNFCLQVLARSFDFLHPYCLSVASVILGGHMSCFHENAMGSVLVQRFPQNRCAIHLYILTLRFRWFVIACSPKGEPGCSAGTRSVAGSSLGAQCASATAMLPCSGPIWQAAICRPSCSHGNL